MSVLFARSEDELLVALENGREKLDPSGASQVHLET
jgi:hypothetical protein